MKKRYMPAAVLAGFFAMAGCRHKHVAPVEINHGLPPGERPSWHDTEEDAFIHTVKAQDRLQKGEACLRDYKGGRFGEKGFMKIGGLDAVLDPGKIADIRKTDSRRQGADPAADIDADDPGRDWKRLRASAAFEAADNCLNLLGDMSDENKADESNFGERDFWDAKGMNPPDTRVFHRKLIH